MPTSHRFSAPRSAVTVAAAAAAVTAAALVVSPSTAGATPPTGLFSWSDPVRMPAVGTATIAPHPGRETTLTDYTFAAGSATGWRTLAGTAVLAVTAGSIEVTAARGCAATTYAAGKAAVLRAGTYLVRAGQGASVTGLVTEVPGAVTDPLTAGRAAPVKGCAGEASSGVTAGNASRATFAPIRGHGMNHRYARVPAHGSSSFDVEDGKDIGMSHYKLEPGFSAGWHSHYGPFLAIVTAGTLNYYEGHGHGCFLADSYSAGDAFFAVPGAEHNHLLDVPDGAELWGIYLNMPRTAAAVPIVGQQLDSNDFTKLPACERLR